LEVSLAMQHLRLTNYCVVATMQQELSPSFAV